MIKKTFILCFAAFIFISNTHADNYPTGARAVGLSHAVVTISDAWSTFHNQAGIMGVKNPSFGVFYESKYRIDNLSFVAASTIMPTNYGNFGLSFSQFGKESYKEMKVGLAYGMMLTKSLSAGIQLDYFMKSFPENSSTKDFITFELGLIYNLSENITLGLHTFNPILNGYEKEWTGIDPASIYRLGARYEFVEKTSVLFEINKQSDIPFQYRSGIEFFPYKKVALRLGVLGKPFQYSAGIGYKINKLFTDIGFNYHRHLGVTPSISIQYHL